jgi:hypothetical protein
MRILTMVLFTVLTACGSAPSVADVRSSELLFDGSTTDGAITNVGIISDSSVDTISNIIDSSGCVNNCPLSGECLFLDGSLDMRYNCLANFYTCVSSFYSCQGMPINVCTNICSAEFYTCQVNCFYSGMTDSSAENCSDGCYFTVNNCGNSCFGDN